MTDLNHDGLGDILIGAPILRLPGTTENPGEGAVYIYSGGTGELLRLIGPPSGQRNSAFGSTVGSVPDLNGDGVPEFLITAGNEPNGVPPLAVRGVVYIIYSCPADWNADGTTTAADIFGFLNAFFSFAPDADRNHDGTIDTQDFFVYLTAYFNGCE